MLEKRKIIVGFFQTLAERKGKKKGPISHPDDIYPKCQGIFLARSCIHIRTLVVKSPTFDSILNEREEGGEGKKGGVEQEETIP